MKHLHSHTLRASQFFFFLFSFFIFFLTSCIKDDTTLADRALSEIRIDSTSIAPVYNIDKNEVLRITPRITQTGTALDVTYTWEVNQEEYSHDPVFEYPARLLGRYLCRLIVANADGKSFYSFIVNVNSPYEEGITVLVVEQNANKALKIADRGYVLETGNIVFTDTAENMRKDDTVQKAYLGG